MYSGACNFHFMMRSHDFLRPCGLSVEMCRIRRYVGILMLARTHSGEEIVEYHLRSMFTGFV
jgi:hypothetical protein